MNDYIEITILCDFFIGLFYNESKNLNEPDHQIKMAARY